MASVSKLPPHPHEIVMASKTLAGSTALPHPVKTRLERRQSLSSFGAATPSHPINLIQYSTFPVTITQQQIQQLEIWGTCFTTLLEKLSLAYFSHPEGYVRTTIDSALLNYYPRWLLSLIRHYTTDFQLAGAHIGDDHFNGKSIEWNLGAVGGLEEGLGVAETLTNSPPPLTSVERDSIETVRDAILFAYTSHSKANNRSIRDTPTIAYVEHDDIYYSSVRTVRKLRELGCHVIYTFHHTLSFDGRHLRTAQGEIIDIVYLDCHLEDLNPNHPIVEALQHNKVALDSSPFARLVLRSKVIMVLLSSPECHRALNLSQTEVEMIQKHLTHSVLLNDYKTQSTQSSPLPHASDLEPRKKKVVKIAIGSVFGGNGVMVAPPNLSTETIINRFKPLKRLFSMLATEKCHVHYTDILRFSKTVEIRALFTELFKTSAALPFDKKENPPRLALNEQKSQTAPKQLNKTVFFDQMRKRVNTFLEESPNKTTHQLCFIDFKQLLEQSLFTFLDKSSINNKLLDRLMDRYRQFYMTKLMNRNIPVIVQDFVEPEKLTDIYGLEETEEMDALEKELGAPLYLSHRIHVLFTDAGKKVFISGSQIFPMHQGKQDNRMKMTCALVHPNEAPIH